MAAASVTLKLRCDCGKVKGAATNITPSATNRAVCYCGFCQSYAGFLERKDQVLDELGGTEVFQLSPREISFSEGQGQIDCIKLTEKGALRWFAKCCSTPLVTTGQNLDLPFIAINHFCVETFQEPENRDRALGPIRARVNGQGIEYAQLPKTGRWSIAKMMVHMVVLMLKWKVGGDAKKSPIRTTEGLPIVNPTRVKVARR